MVSSKDLLRQFEIESDTFSGNGLLGLNLKFPQLETLDLLHCQSLTFEGVRELLRISGPNLKVLKFSLHNFTEEILAGLDVKFIKLEILAIHDRENLADDQVICKLLDICGPQLQELDLSATTISGAALAEWMKNHPLDQLKELWLIECRDLTDQGLTELLAISGHQLKQLNISATPISGARLADLMEVHPLGRLQVLQLYFCENVCIEDIRRLSSLVRSSCRVETTLRDETEPYLYMNESDSDEYYE